MSTLSIEGEHLSYNGQKLNVDDTVYQVGSDENNLPTLLAIRVVELQPQSQIIVAGTNPNDGKLELVTTHSRNVHTNGIDLLNTWLENSNNLYQNQLPKQIERLELLISDYSNNPNNIPHAPETNNTLQQDVEI